MKVSLPAVILVILASAFVPHVPATLDSKTIDLIAQFGLGLPGVIAIILVSRKNRWGFVWGMVAQPFWFTTALINHQWGVFALSVIYTGSYTYGVYQWFFKKPKEE